MRYFTYDSRPITQDEAITILESNQKYIEESEKTGNIALLMNCQFIYTLPDADERSFVL